MALLSYTYSAIPAITVHADKTSLLLFNPNKAETENAPPPLYLRIETLITDHNSKYQNLHEVARLTHHCITSVTNSSQADTYLFAYLYETVILKMNGCCNEVERICIVHQCMQRENKVISSCSQSENVFLIYWHECQTGSWYTSAPPTPSNNP